MIRHGFDAAYIERLVAGERQTESHFFAYFSELILIKARARRLAPAQAEEIRQETLLRVLRKLRSEGLLSPEALGAFVNSVCNHVLQEGFRDRERHPPPLEDPAPLADTSAPNPEVQLITKERQEAVRRVIEAMSPDNRWLLREVLLEERDRAEVCREFGVTADYLRVLIHRAKKEFRALYLKRERPMPGGDGGRTTREAEGDSRTARRPAGERRPSRGTLGL